MTTIKTKATYAVDSATKTGSQALVHARSVLLSAIAELDRYINSYEATESLEAKARVLNSSLRLLTSYVPSNLRVDLLANAQVALVRAAALVRAVALVPLADEE